ncbi:MAG: 2 protein [Dehalococcoidales bacterium]|nr:2 protein [Dehalococcoidales bacterium]
MAREVLNAIVSWVLTHPWFVMSVIIFLVVTLAIWLPRTNIPYLRRCFEGEMKGKMLKALLPATLIMLLLFPHYLAFYKGYTDDAESIYARAGSQIAEHGLNANLSEYFRWVANPPFASFLLAVGYRLFGESPTVSRFVTFLLPFIFSLFLYFYLRRREGVFGAFVPVLLVIANPVFIAFSKYVGSDAPFLAFSSTSLLLLLYANLPRWQILSSIMLGIALATKYLALFLFPVALVYSLVKARIFSEFSRTRLFSVIRFNLWYFLLALLVSAPFLAIGFTSAAGARTPIYGFMFVPDEWSEVAPNAGGFIPRLFAYLMYLGLFVGPFFLILVPDLWKRISKVRFLILLGGLAVLTFVVHLFFPVSSLHTYGGIVGEMNIGLESYFFPTYLDVGLFLALLVAEILVVSLTLDLMHRRDDKIIYLFCWILLPILLMPLLRDAQRYLLTVLVPLSLYMTFVAKRMYSERRKPFVMGVLALHVMVYLYWGVLLMNSIVD